MLTWSRGMNRMSGILILSYRLKEVINSYVLHCFWTQKIVHIFGTRCLIEMKFRSKCNILNGQVIYVENSKLKIANMWLIPLDRVTMLLSLPYARQCLCQEYLKVLIFWQPFTCCTKKKEKKNSVFIATTWSTVFHSCLANINYTNY